MKQGRYQMSVLLLSDNHFNHTLHGISRAAIDSKNWQLPSILNRLNLVEFNHKVEFFQRLNAAMVQSYIARYSKSLNEIEAQRLLNHNVRFTYKPEGNLTLIQTLTALRSIQYQIEIEHNDAATLNELINGIKDVILDALAAPQENCWAID
jgi:hypothetical protein